MNDKPRTWTLIIDDSGVPFSTDAPIKRVRVIELDPVLDLLKGLSESGCGCEDCAPAQALLREHGRLEET